MAVGAHHRPGGGFRNPWAAARTHGFLDFLKWTLVDRRRAPSGGRPEPRASPLPFAGPRRLVPPAVDFDDLPPIDAVFLSHDHYDHLDSRTIRQLIRRYPAIAWFVPLGVGKFLESRGAREVSECDWWQESATGSLTLTCVPAQHFSGRRLDNRNAPLWCGWALRSACHSILFAGDTALHPGFALIAERSGPFDVAILPIGAYEPRWFMGPVHMNPEDCLIAAGQLREMAHGRRLVLVGAHWGAFKLTDEPVDEPPERMRANWRTAGLADNDLWVMRHGETQTIPAICRTM